jgi:hypothetical protein
VVDLYSDIVMDVTDWIAYDGLHPTDAIGDAAGVVQQRQERVRGTANIGCDDEQSGSPEHNTIGRGEPRR